MPVTLDITGDFLYFDNRETVTYQQVAPDGTTTDFTGVQALMEGVREVPAGAVEGVVEGTTWHIQVATLNTITPAIGDRVIQADGTQWSVVRVEYLAWLTRWQLDTVRGDL